MSKKKASKLKAEHKEPSKQVVRDMAKNLGIERSHRINVATPVIKTMNKHKGDLIKEIQACEGSNVCYNSGITDCKSTDCLWFASCQK